MESYMQGEVPKLGEIWLAGIPSEFEDDLDVSDSRSEVSSWSWEFFKSILWNIFGVEICDKQKLDNIVEKLNGLKESVDFGKKVGDKAMVGSKLYSRWA